MCRYCEDLQILQQMMNAHGKILQQLLALAHLQAKAGVGLQHAVEDTGEYKSELVDAVDRETPLCETMATFPVVGKLHDSQDYGETSQHSQEPVVPKESTLIVDLGI
ncbi:hypothetical protein R1flu_017235 [Riccia fluitans]|uniref:Uncharacterized protein n=2 Tax=Riccia fluitans TaxID=41844 RepID=A0ABD1XH82_9MARC